MILFKNNYYSYSKNSLEKNLDLFKITDPKYAYVIAQIGKNHQGSFDRAIKLIDEAIWAGAEAVKFQKRCNKKLFTTNFFNSSYDNDNSFANTYGKHREFSELDIEEMSKLNDYCIEKGLTFFATPFDFQSLDELEKLNLLFYKVASADVLHKSFLEKISKTNKNVILITGCSTYEDVQKAVNCFRENSLAILHYTAAYPAPIESMNLNCIPALIKKFPKYKIGISDYQNGVDAVCISYMLGARVFEKHFT